MDKQWFDDMNTEFVDSRHTMDIKVSKLFAKKITAQLSVQDLFDEQFVDRKGLLSPGRFILLELKYKI